MYYFSWTLSLFFLKHKIGCCSKYSPNFQEQVADGIIGLGHSNTLVKALQDHGELLAHQMALCIGPEKGRFTVGGCEWNLICFFYSFLFFFSSCPFSWLLKKLVI